MRIHPPGLDHGDVERIVVRAVDWGLLPVCAQRLLTSQLLRAHAHAIVVAADGICVRSFAHAPDNLGDRACVRASERASERASVRPRDCAAPRCVRACVRACVRGRVRRRVRLRAGHTHPSGGACRRDAARTCVGPGWPRTGTRAPQRASAGPLCHVVLSSAGPFACPPPTMHIGGRML